MSTTPPTPEPIQPDPAQPAPAPAGAAPADGTAEPAEQTPQASSKNGLVTGLIVVIAALVVALGLVSATALRSTPSATHTVTVTAGQGEAAPPQRGQQATPATDVPEKTKKARLEVARHEAGDPLSYGKADAPVTLVEFADLRCPFCAVFTTQRMPQLQKYIDDGTLRVEYRDMPLFGEDSFAAAIAARAAGNQGKYHDYLVTLYQAAPAEGGHPPMPKDKLLGFAKKAGVPDLARFEKEMADPALRKKVEADLAYGQKIGVSGTPLFLINTQVLSGAQPVEVFAQFIEHEKKNNPSKRG